MIETLIASTPQVIQKYLIDNGYGEIPGGVIDDVQISHDQTLLIDPPKIYTRSAPDQVNYLIFLKQIRGRLFEMVDDGEPNNYHGLHVMVRHPDERGYTLAHSLLRFLGKTHNVTVTIGEFDYRIQSIYRTHDVMDLGEEAEKGRANWAFEANVVYQYPPYISNED